MTKPLDRIAFEYWAGVGSKTDFEAWAVSELRKEEPHPDACEMFNLSEEEAEKQSIRLSAEILNFEPVSEKGEEWAKELLMEYCEKLLNEKITPFEFCRLVEVFDVNFLGIRTHEDGSLEYPEWLGDLWNNCDWCDETWTLSNSPHLAEEADKVLKNET